MEFKAIYEEYNLYVRKTIYFMVPSDAVDDLVQETFVKIWKNISKFKGDSKIKTWVYRIAVNTSIDFLRRNKINVEYKDTNEESPSNLESNTMNSQLIATGIKQLSEKQRSVFVLYYQLELSIEEIAESLKIPKGTVKSRLHSSRAEFTEYLERNGVKYE